ncbi:hypothetical protein J14TS5_10440 [Paenibacillus lautus]|uniref:hypothetical protein n=1 Tax=Paenibacillus lautus TaxID=1401 RepID=UPI001B10D781|nr:hypothetical protein [Paenibacillus lautus]GIO95958.1 hypothetical protein J14TS5_10440 [Paenibacillus lautus]
MKQWNMKLHNHDDKDCKNSQPKSPDNKQTSRYRMLSVSMIVTTILWFSTVQPQASMAAASQADVSISANSLNLTGTQLTADHHILGVSGVNQNNHVAQVPGSLMDFAEETVAQLSAHAPFTTWDEAKLEFTPLGPGTHGWLVTISAEGLPQGYMIISAGEDGGYILSEYGIGSTLPYSQAPLKERLAAEGLVKAEGSLPQGSIVRKLYDVSPVWQVQLPGKKPIYFSALNSEALPDEPQPTHSTTKPVSVSLPDASKGLVASSTSNHWYAGTPFIATGDSIDPYDNLLWLTSSDLTTRSSADLRNLLQEHSTLIFKSKKGNAAYGAPFNLTGWHRWSSGNQENPAALYVSVPLRNTDTLRFLPASRLIGQGQFYAQPE